MCWRSSTQIPTALKVLVRPRNGPHRSDGVKLDHKNEKQDRADEHSQLGRLYGGGQGVLIPPGRVGHDGQSSQEGGEEEERDEDGLHLSRPARSTRRLTVLSQADLENSRAQTPDISI